MVTGPHMTEHINYIKILTEHLQGIDEITEKDSVIILISSLLEECKHLITALETTADDYLLWDYVEDRLLHEKTIGNFWEQLKLYFTKSKS